MDDVLDCYFDHVVAELDRDSLLVRHRRLQLVQFLGNAVRAWCLAEGAEDPEPAVAAAVRRAARYHADARTGNYGVCRSGKYHDVLYVAAKMSHDWQLRDPQPVAELLAEMYACERSFERLLCGALVGVKAAHLLCGWRSDYASREECARAAGYFLEHAARAHLEHGPARARTADIPVDSYSGAPPVKVAVQLGSLDMLELLLRHGARLEPPTDLEPLFSRLVSSPEPLDVACLQLVLRATPCVCTSPSSSCVLELVDKGLVPPSRCGLAPPELKHLCRCAIREALWTNFQLPLGIPRLNLPASLHQYLDLADD